MAAEMALRLLEKPEAAKRHIDRVLTNLAALQSELEALRRRPLPPNAAAASIEGDLDEVLLIDDSSDYRAFFLTILKSRGWNPHAAQNAAEANAVLSRNGKRFLVLLDYHLAKATAHDVLDALEAAGHLAKCKVILFTSRDQPPRDDRIFAVEDKAFGTQPLLEILRKYQ